MKDIPEYCQVMRVTGPDGLVKEFFFPKALDLSRPKRPRTTFTTEQLEALEFAFQSNPYLVGKERKKIAKDLLLTEAQVKVWYQNRRTKKKVIKDDVRDLKEPDTNSEGHFKMFDGNTVSSTIKATNYIPTSTFSTFVSTTNPTYNSTDALNSMRIPSSLPQFPFHFYNNVLASNPFASPQNFLTKYSPSFLTGLMLSPSSSSSSPSEEEKQQ